MTDIKILSNLLHDSRISYRQIANKVGISVGTVIAKIKKMERMGIIKGYSVMLDHEKLGYDLTVITELTVSKGKLLKVEKEIAKIPNVCAVYDVTGLTDVMVIGKFRNRKELSNFTKSMLKMQYIERTNTHVILGTIKEDFRLLELIRGCHSINSSDTNRNKVKKKILLSQGGYK